MLLALYATPLATVATAFFASDHFNKYAASVGFGTYISTAYAQVHDVIGKLLLPFFAAFSIPRIKSGMRPPLNSVILIAVFVILTLAGWGLNAAADLYSGRLENFGQGTAKVYQDLTGEYLKEGLTYIALLLGVSLKKS